MNFNDIQAKIKEKWTSFSPGQRSAVIVMAIAILVSGIFFWQWSNKVEYAPLYAQLAEKDSGAVVAKLKELKIPYQISTDGGTILVPKDQVYDVRFQLASSLNLNGGGMGFELFDQTKLGATDFERKVNYQRALQEELRRTIVGLDQVDQARVHLVIPDKSVFIEDEKAATASVVLKMKPYAKLTPEEVKGIIYLVANSVENLKPEDVRVIDMNGMVLSDEVNLDSKDNSGMVAVKQQDYKREYEKEMENRLQHMLETVLGPGKAVAMVSSDIDFSAKETDSVIYDKNGVVRSEQAVNDITYGNGSLAQGVAGTNTNVQTYPTVNSQGQNGNHLHNEMTKNYEVGQTQQKSTEPPGKVLRISASVIVDGQLSPAKIDQIKQIVSAAMGYSASRNDQIAVQSMNFDKTDTANFDKEVADMERKKTVEEYVKWGVIAFGLLLTFIFGIIFVRKKYEPQENSLSFDVPLGMDNVAPLNDVEVEHVLPVAMPESEAPEEENSIEEVKKLFQASPEKKRQDRAKEIVSNRPEEVAQLIKAWLSEEK